jgi:hypothetical protein
MSTLEEYAFVLKQAKRSVEARPSWLRNDSSSDSDAESERPRTTRRRKAQSVKSKAKANAR